VTDGRFSGATHGFMVGHVSPEAAHGGPIARLREGDRVRIDVGSRRIDVAADLSTREPARIAPRVTRGALAKYAQQVGSASSGAVTTPGKTGVRAQFPPRTIPPALAATAEIGL
jgi:dihydroxy-acid dehydratase